MKKKRADKKKQNGGFLLFLMTMLITFMGLTFTNPAPVSAVLPETTALAHYTKYGDSINYFDNGHLYWADRYATSTSGIKWHVMGFRVKVTVNGRTNYVDYKNGQGALAGWGTRSPALSNIGQQSGSYSYTRDGLNYNALIDDITAKDATTGRWMSNGDYDVRIVFDAITEVYNSSTDTSLRGPNYTAAETKADLLAYGMSTTIVDDYYGMTINIDQLNLPIVKYVTKGVSFPNGGGDLKSGTTYLYYVKPGKMVYVDTTFKSQKVNLTTQYFFIGDTIGGANALDDFMAYYSHGTQTFTTSNASPDILWSSASDGPANGSANTNSLVRNAFSFVNSGETWVAYGEARNANGIYYGGSSAEYKHMYTFITDGAVPTFGGIPSSTWTDSDVTFTPTANDTGSGIKTATLTVNGNLVQTITPTVYDTAVSFTARTATGTATYRIDATDNVGNITSRTFTVNIDKTAPTGNLTQTPTAWTNGNVTLNLTSIADAGGSSYYRTRLPNGTFVTTTSASYIVSSNGTYSFDIYDDAGNVTTKSIYVSNIDKTAPTGNLAQTPTTWTNGNVTLNLTGVVDTGGSGVDSIRLPNGTYVTGTSASQVVSVNGTYSFVIYDNAGNSTTKSIYVSNIDDFAPAGNLAQTPIGDTNGNVTLNLTAIADTGGSGYYRTKLPNGTFVTTTSASQVVSVNGTYSFVIYDNAGNSTTKSITVSNIDDFAPTGNLAQTPIGDTNGNVTLNLTAIADTGGSGYYRTLLPSGVYVTTTTASYVVSANGTYSFIIYDNAGNSTTKSITVSNIDKIAPTGNLAQTPTSWTNGNVTLNLTSIADNDSGVKNIKLPNGTLVTGTTASQSVSVNGTYSFIIYDNAGNSTTKSITVSNIEEVAPTGTLTQTPTDDTNGNVTLNLTSIADTGGSGYYRTQLPTGAYVTTITASHVVTTNGSYSFVIYDNAGNSITKTIFVTNIDKTAPTGNLAQTPTSWTNGNVTLNLTSISDVGSGVQSIRLPNGTLVTGTSASQVVSVNGTYSFVITDNAGNPTTKTIVVSNIEGIDPTGTLTLTPTIATNDDVTLNLTAIADTGGSGYYRTKLPNGTFVTTTSASQMVPTNGTYSFVIYDNAGNSTTKTIVVSNIDKTAPTGNLAQTPLTWTNGNVTLNLTSIADVGSGVKNIQLPNGTLVTGTSASQIVSVNGTYSFVITDNAGNSTIKTIVVSNIDEIAPTGTLTQTPTGATNGNVTLNLASIADTGGSGYYRTQLPNGTFVTTTSASHVVTVNGTYSFVIYDNAGNSTTKSITVSNIDKTAPTGTLAQTPITWTNGSVTLNLTAIADTGGSGLENIQLPNGTYVTGTSAFYQVSANGTYSFVIYDNAGNSTTKSITVSNIDKTLPSGTLTASTTAWTNQDVTLNLTAVSDTGGSGLKNISLPNGTVVTGTSASQVVSSNGTYSFVMYDNAGNARTNSITVSNIDKTVPIGSVVSSNTSPTNQPVILTASGSDTGSGLELIELLTGNYTGRNLLVNSNREVTGVNEFLQFGDISPIIDKNGLVPITISFDIKVAVPGNVNVYAQNGSTAKYSIGGTPIPATTSYVRHSVTVTPTLQNATVSQTMLAFYGTYGSGRIATVRNVKVELGSIESAYTQAPEDIALVSGKKEFEVTNNGTYEFLFEDKAGNQTKKSLTVNNIDTLAPTGTLSQSPTSWTNGNVTLNLASVVDTGGSGLKNIQLPNGTLVTTTSASQVVTVNGSYSFIITDNAGNVTDKTIVVTNIDKNAPTATLSQTPIAWTGGNVTLNLTSVVDSGGSALKNIQLPNGTLVTGTSATYVVTTNGTYSFTVYDNAGNATTKSITVSNIDKTAPTGTLSQNPTTWTNGNITLTLSGVTDGSGAGIKHIIRPDNILVTGVTSATHVVTANGTYTFKMVDNVGNESTESITVDNIDKVTPSATLNPNSVSWTNDDQSIAVTVSDSGGSSLKNWRSRVSIDNGSTYGAWSTTSTTSTGTIALNTHGIARIQIEVTDNAGNSTTVTSGTYSLDKIEPNGTVTPSTTAWMNGTVTLTATGTDVDSGVSMIKKPDGSSVTATSTTYVVTTNGIYSFVVTDKAGNTKTISITVSNIEKLAPTGSLAQTPTSWTNGNVTLNLTSVMDTGGSGLRNIQLPNGTLVTGTSASQVVTANGSYSFIITDNAGNSTTKTIAVGNVDKVNSTGTVTFVPGDTALTIRYDGLDNLSGVKSIVLPNSTIVTGSTASFNVTTPGTYIAIVEDNAGNKANIVATVQAPNVTITKEITDWTNRESYALTVTTSPRYVAKAKIQASFEGTSWLNENQRIAQISENGIYEFKVNDGGIVATGSISVTNFDRQKSIISIQEKAMSASQATYNIRVTEVGDVKP